MLFRSSVLVASFLAGLLVAPAAHAENDDEFSPAMAPFSSVEAIPVVSEVDLVQTGEIALPQGWFFVGMIEGGFLLEHENGSRIRIMRCVQTTSYRVAWSLTYEQDGMQCVDSNIVRVNEPLPGAPSADGVTLRVQVPNECVAGTESSPAVSDDCQSRIPATAITAPWPSRVVQALLDAMNAQTRRGICTP